MPCNSVLVGRERGERCHLFPEVAPLIDVRWLRYALTVGVYSMSSACSLAAGTTPFSQPLAA